MSIFGPSPVQMAVERAIATLEAGDVVVERQQIDLKEEAGRRGPRGVIFPAQCENEKAIEKLAPEIACMASTAGGGALLLGVADDSTVIGTELDEEWVRLRLYERLDRRVTCDVRPVVVAGKRVLVIVVPEAVEPIRFNGRVTWRVGDSCVEIDASTWHERRHHRLRHDWSLLPSEFTIEQVRATAVELARDFLRDTGDPSSTELAEAATSDLLRRLNAIDGDGRLTNAAAIVFIGRGSPALDYIRRDTPGGDSVVRVRRPNRSLLEELHEVFTTSLAYDPVTHLGDGLTQSQVRQIPERALREAIVNGVAHREWTIDEPTVIEHIGGRLRVTSPGGFFPGVSSENIIAHPSLSRNRALVELLAALRIAEREGIGVDRMYGDMLRLGCPAPEIREIDGPAVLTVLVGTDPDPGWMAWLRAMSSPDVSQDLQQLMAVAYLVQHGWLDEEILAPYLQVQTAEARATISELLQVTVAGKPLLSAVRGIPAGDSPAWALSVPAWEALDGFGRTAGRLRQRLPREAVALDYARTRGRISSTELADLVGAQPSNVGTVLGALEADGLLRPSRENRRGPGFHYVFAAE